jgi:hypothetical protein
MLEHSSSLSPSDSAAPQCRQVRAEIACALPTMFLPCWYLAKSTTFCACIMTFSTIAVLAIVRVLSQKGVAQTFSPTLKF